MKITSFDLETKLIGEGAIAPEIICATVSTEEGVQIQGNDDKGKLKQFIIDNVLTADVDLIVGSNIAYDFGCVINQWDDLIPQVCAIYDNDKVFDIQIAEKLRVLGTTGNLEMLELPDGSYRKLSYSQLELEKTYLGIDRSHQKHGDDIWRTNYSMLDGVPAEQYPDGALQYAIEDAINARLIAEQLVEANNVSATPFHSKSAFSLFVMTIFGWKIDPDEVLRIKTQIDAELADEHYELIIEAGILRPEEPPRLKVRGEGYTKGKKASINKKALQEHVVAASKKIGKEVKYTDPSDRFPEGQVSTSGDVIAELALHDFPEIKQYHHRQRINKLKTTYLPQFYDEETGRIYDRIHASYDTPKRTLRTSSFANRLYPSVNIQQQDPRIRSCFVADDGYILASADYSALEFCSAAWRFEQIFGKGNSKLANLVRQGKDVHAYTGGPVLAAMLDSGFKEQIEGLSDDQVYDFFVSLKNSESDTDKEFYNHYRTFAKPTGLGYLGGLGAATFIKFSKGYGIYIEKIAAELGMDAEDLAYRIRDAWMDAFPDIRQYLTSYITSDMMYIDQYGEEKYIYDTPLGTVRAGCDYCAAANGAAMQSPAAEGARLAVWRVVRACIDPSVGSILYGSIPLAFIHDEIIIEVLDDENRGTRATELARIMEEAMSEVLSGIPIRAEPLLSRIWDKKAKPVYDETGELVVYGD